jgi:eukaryotic-like serine/threonine-protein kinase
MLKLSNYGLRQKLVDILAGRYEIIKVLGGGGFAIAFLAQDNLQPSKPLCSVFELS